MKTVRMTFFVLFLMVLTIPLVSAEDVAQPASAPVELDGKILFAIQAGTKTFSPQMRAAQIAARIKELAGDFTFRPEKMATDDFGFATEISGDGRFVMAVFDADAKAEGGDRETLAKAYAIKIQRAIEAYRAERSISNIVTGIVFTLISTVVLDALIFNEGGVEIMSPHYAQLRDGNQTTIPERYLPEDYLSPSIRIVDTGALARSSRLAKETKG